MVGRRPQHGLAAGLPGPSPSQGHLRHARLGSASPRPSRHRSRRARAPGDAGQGPGGHGARRRGGRRRPVAGRGGWQGRPGQRPLPVEPPACPRFRRAGRARRGAVVVARVEADGRRGPGRVPQRGQVDPHQPDLGGQAQDRRLPVHHPGAQPRSRPSGRRRVAIRDGRGRCPRAHRGGRRGPRTRPPVPAPHRTVQGAAGDARPMALRRGDTVGAAGSAAR